MGHILMMRASCLLIMLVLLGVAAVTQGCGSLPINGTVAGRVFMNEKLMPNFEVQLVNESGQVSGSAKTNQQGHFIIQNVKPGKYTIQVLDFSGRPRPDYSDELLVRIGRTETVDIDLGGGKLLKPTI